MKKTRIIKSKKSKWTPVSLDPTVLNSADFEGLVGIEELTGYSVSEAETALPRKKSQQRSKKVPIEEKLPSEAKKHKKKRKGKQKNVKVDIADDHLQASDENQCAKVLEDKDDLDLSSRMAAWNGLGVPSILLRALEDKSFTVPTKIQALTLPPAIFGRRDILGAAETGSGKTLAFGLPILHGVFEEMNKGMAQVDNIVETHSSNDNKEMECAEDDNSESSDAVNCNMEDIEEMEFAVDENSESDDAGDNEDKNSADENEDIDSFDGTAQCTKVIDNVEFNFPTVGGKKSKAQYIKKPLYALILTPTRELAVQITQHLKSAAKYTNIDIAVVVGGLSSQKQERLLNRGPAIIVATPGRLWELIDEGHPHLLQVDTIRYLAIDETDRMLEKGHFDELQRILGKVNTSDIFRQKRQNFIFSATLTLTHEPPRYIMKKKSKNSKGQQSARLTPAQKLANIIETVGVTDPKIVDITESSGVAQLLTEAQIVCSMDKKDYYLYYFLQRHPGRTLVFCNSIEAVRRLTQLFTLLGCSPWPLHAKMQQKQRLKNLERFCSNPRGVLLATDVAARGLDIPNIQHVIHYQIPRTAEGYVHRSGRTARAQQEGLTVLLVEPAEVNNLTRLFRTLGREVDLPTFPIESEWMPMVKQRVDLARVLDKLELQAKRITTEHGWFDKVVKEMDLEISDDELPTSYSRDGGNKLKKQAESYRKQLTTLLSKPLFPKGFSTKYPTQTGKLIVPLFPGSIQNSSDSNPETAVEALKQSIEEQKALKRKLNRERSKRNKRKRRLAKQLSVEGSPSSDAGSEVEGEGGSSDEDEDN